MHRTHTSTNVTKLKKETDIEKKKKNIVLITKNDIRENEENIIMRKIKKKKWKSGQTTLKVVDSL